MTFFALIIGGVICVSSINACTRENKVLKCVYVV